MNVKCKDLESWEAKIHEAAEENKKEEEGRGCEEWEALDEDHLEEVKLLKTLVSDLEKELKTKGRADVRVTK